jgi:dihydroxyacetone kinase-like protein
MSGPDGLDPQSLADALLDVAGAMRESVPELTHADQAIGDGDHGLAIERGFQAVATALAKSAHDDIGEVFETTGTAMLMSMGGASGAIYGTFFRRGGSAVRGRRSLDAECFATFLEEALRGVVERCGANVGDKTIIDAVTPAAAAANLLRHGSLSEALGRAAQAAEAGAERTRGLRATLGRARAVGERAIGHVDPGALSFSIMLRELATASNQRLGGPS